MTKRVTLIGELDGFEAVETRADGRPLTFDFDPARATTVLERMKRASDGPIALDGADWAQGAMGALLHAEFLAAEAGLVPWFNLPGGERGIVTIGAARERIDQAPEDVRTIYLATHGIVRATHAEARKWDGAAPTLGEMRAPEDIGGPEIIIAVAIVAIAAIIGTAWYLTSKSAIEVEGRNVRTTALASDVAALAREQLSRTGKIDPGVWEVFKTIADNESGHSLMLPIVLGTVAVAGVGGALAWKHLKKSKKGAER